MSYQSSNPPDPLLRHLAGRRAELLRQAFAPRRCSPADVAAGVRPLDLRHPLERDELRKLLKPATPHAD